MTCSKLHCHKLLIQSPCHVRFRASQPAQQHHEPPSFMTRDGTPCGTRGPARRRPPATPASTPARFHRGEYFWKVRFRGSPIRSPTKFTTHWLWDVTGSCECVEIFIEKSYLPEILAAMRLSQTMHQLNGFSKASSPTNPLTYSALRGVDHRPHQLQRLRHPRVDARQTQKSISRIYGGIDVKSQFPLPLT